MKNKIRNLENNNTCSKKRNKNKFMSKASGAYLNEAKKTAFTLAEVLITIGIIGGVAAMTLPAVINKHREASTVAKVKKFYSIMSQALLSTIAEQGGTVDTWESFVQAAKQTSSAKTSAVLMSYFKPYLKIGKDCGTTTGSGCIANTNIKLMDGTKVGNYNSSSNYYKLVLADGTTMWMRHNKNCAVDDITEGVCALFWLDTGGMKGTHTMGKEIFVFYLYKDRLAGHANDDCYSEGGKGWGCAKHIILYGNMNYPESADE